MNQTYNTHTYILSWDMYGLESCINISDMEKQQMWDALSNKNAQGKNNNISSIVGQLMLRARFNHQRHYEIYAIETEQDISAKDLKTMFKDNPQDMANLVRQKGHKLYSDRYPDDEQIKIR